MIKIFTSAAISSIFIVAVIDVGGADDADWNGDTRVRDYTSFLFLFKRNKRTGGAMTILATFSYGFIAFGPTVVLFAVTVARNAYQVILLMTG